MSDLSPGCIRNLFIYFNIVFTNTRTYPADCLLCRRFLAEHTFRALEFVPTAKHIPLGWNATERIAWESVRTATLRNFISWGTWFVCATLPGVLPGFDLFVKALSSRVNTDIKLLHSTKLHVRFRSGAQKFCELVNRIKWLLLSLLWLPLSFSSIIAFTRDLLTTECFVSVAVLFGVSCREIFTCTNTYTKGKIQYLNLELKASRLLSFSINFFTLLLSFLNFYNMIF